MAKRAGYHHGDLKATLVAGALELIAERGVASLSVAEVARRAHVSGGAPYRHFPSRQALLTAVATKAAHTLADRLREVSTGAGPDPVENMATVVAAYARFTAEHGAGFDLIFAVELSGRGNEELADAGRTVMDALLQAALPVTGDAKAALGLIGRTFAAAHGYATLWRSGLYINRNSTVDDVTSEAAAIARTLAGSVQTPLPRTRS
ncbi:TetR/AcrR family transcriptional regulator [Streptomyces sp. NPDC088847]|uniref:TetR/AcrR family transcriptional regulator n=1 Tax=Streptomyces sp. NPDC088847 TaxID=3365909 RepID=UPI003813DC21